MFVFRVLIIPDVNLYDQGIYRCFVERLNGLTANKTITLTLQCKCILIVQFSCCSLLVNLLSFFPKWYQ